MSGAKRGANRSANFLIQSSGNSNLAPCFWPKVPIFLFKSSARKIKIKFEKNRESRWTPTKKGSTCLSLSQAPEDKRRKIPEKRRIKQGENRLGVPNFIENLGK